MNTVNFRLFEPRDLDFIYRCKSDEKLNNMVVGNYKKLNYDESKVWLDGCIRADNPTMRFWAICTNDEEQRIIGWVSLSQIDRVNQSACYHGLVIADSDYHDGFSWIEAYLFIMKYVFEELKLNRLYGSSLMGHKMSNLAGGLLFFEREGIFRQAVYKNNQFYDLMYEAILKNDYFKHKQLGEYEIMSIIRRLRKLLKSNTQNIE